MNDPIGYACIKTCDDVIKDNPRAMFYIFVYISCWLNFKNIKKPKEKKNNKEVNNVVFKNEKP